MNIALNIAMASLVTWLTLAGAAKGVTRYLGEDTPAFVLVGTEYLFPALGGILALILLHLAVSWLRIAVRVPAQEREHLATRGTESLPADAG